MHQDNEIKATDAAREKAERAGLNLSALLEKGTGKDGLITGPDVDKAVAEVEEAVEETVVITGEEERFYVNLNPEMGRIKHVAATINGESRKVYDGDTMNASEFEEARQARTGPLYGHPNGVQMILKGGKA